MLEILPENLEPGAVLCGYRLDRILGEGGMGIVWAARETTTGRDVALKVLQHGREADPKNQERILREASAAMTISHPNVVKVEAVLQTEAGVPFFVMELLEGESLRALLLRRGALEVVEGARILGAVVDAVLAAHARAILHRDLKPENVFLVRGTEVRVLDFGIAKQLPRADASVDASLTSTGAILGTPHYMAPEQVYGDEDIDTRADVWSLGVMLYECLAGKRPTEAEGFGPILKRITTGVLEPLEKARPGLPRRLTKLTDRMLARDRAERPPLSEVRDVLAAVATGDLDDGPPSEALETTLPETRVEPRPEGRRWARSRYAVGAVVLLLLGLVALVALVAPRLRARSKHAGDPMSLLLAASNDQNRRDGRACLRDLDEFDALPERTIPPSTDLGSGYAGVRATCMMLTGDCEAGKKLYRSWLPLHSPPMEDRYFDLGMEQIGKQFCATP